MRKEYFKRAKETGYGKYTELAQHFQNIIQTCEMLRDDLNVFFMMHVEEVTSDNTVIGYQLSTIGKLLLQQYNPVECVPMVLFSSVKYNDKGQAEFGFYTHRCKQGTVEIPAKCFAKGTQIIMADGSLKKVEDIREGDMVLNTDNNSSKVLSVHSGIDNMYLVNQKYGMDYIVNSQHILCTTEGEIPAAEAVNKEGLKGLRQAVDYNNHIAYPYYLGLWLGDGDSDCTAITTMDPEIIDYCEQLAKQCNLNFIKYEKEGNKAVRIHLGSIQSYTRKIKKYDLKGNFLEEYSSLKEAAVANNIKDPSNISHCASGKYQNCGGYKWEYGEYLKHNPLREVLNTFNLLNNKHIPEEFKTMSLSDRLEFLAGLIDSDGTKSDNRFVISTALYHVAKDIVAIANSCGFDACISVYHNPTYNKDYYRVTLAGNLQTIPVKLPRKKITKPSANTNWINVEPIGKGEYFGFTLEGPCKTCMLPDFTVVHNSPDGMFDKDFIPNDLGLVVKAMNEYYG